MRISDWSSDVCSSDLRCVKSDPRVDAGDNREAYRLGNERKRNDNPGEDVSARSSHTAEPFLAVTGNMFGHRKRESATRYTARESAGEMNVRDVARRSGGQESHSRFQRVIANG